MGLIDEMVMKWALKTFVPEVVRDFSDRRRLRREEAAEKWPTVQGEVFSTDTKRYGEMPLARLTVVYHYHLADYHSGTFRSFYETQELADYIADEIRKGPLKLHYCREKPEQSVLFLEDTPSDPAHSWRDEWYK
jgi:hypothetical protein